MLGDVIRRQVAGRLAGQSQLTLKNELPSRDQLASRFESLDQWGLYLHVPFCRQICPYCPYNKELLCEDAAARYVDAVKQEIEWYAGIVGDRPVTSLYIGGGTPTTMLNIGLGDMLDEIHRRFNVRCDIHMESHLNDLSEGNLAAIESLGVRHLSVGVEALQDKHLEFLKRPYTALKARETVERIVGRDFQCVNVDLMFALPGQTCEEVGDAAQCLIDLGVDQVATYPLFRFPYTAMGSNGRTNNYGLGTVLKRRRMLKVLERTFYSAGYRRSSVWAFTKNGVPRYCSVTVPLYVGLGASGGTYLRDIFYLNTFSVAQYVQAMEERGSAIALSMELPERMQMAGWLYWRIYETQFDKGDFQARFHASFDDVYGNQFRILKLLGFARDDGAHITLTDRGAYWLHALEDILSIDYISKLWGTSRQNPWPEEVQL